MLKLHVSFGLGAQKLRFGINEKWYERKFCSAHVFCSSKGLEVLIFFNMKLNVGKVQKDRCGLKNS